MADVLDYIDWRGDLSFDAAPVNEIDKYIFACIGKPDYTGAIPSDTQSVSIKSAIDAYFALHPDDGDSLGLVASAKTMPALRKIAESERYSRIRLSGFINKVLVEKTEQFSALTVRANGINYISFRGTDDSIVGWKENCEIAVKDNVAAQRDALAYLIWAAENYDGPIVVCGHSKGGNLAIYAAAKAPKPVQERVIEVWSYDGPGFQPNFLQSEGYSRIKHKVTTLVPYKSVVGMLLNQAGQLEIVSSDTSGVAGHDGFTWNVKRDSFDHTSELSDFSKIFRTSIGETLDSMGPDDRKELVEEIFDVLTSTGAFMLSDFTEQNLRQSLEMAKQFRKASELKSFIFKLIEKSIKQTKISREENKESKIQQSTAETV